VVSRIPLANARGSEPFRAATVRDCEIIAVAADHGRADPRVLTSGKRVGFL